MHFTLNCQLIRGNVPVSSETIFYKILLVPILIFRPAFEQNMEVTCKADGWYPPGSNFEYVFSMPVYYNNYCSNMATYYHT